MLPRPHPGSALGTALVVGLGLVLLPWRTAEAGEFYASAASPSSRCGAGLSDDVRLRPS